MAKRTTNTHYVNNKQFLEAMIEWRESCDVAENVDEPQPPVSVSPQPIVVAITG